jgi:hypothetical protein
MVSKDQVRTVESSKQTLVLIENLKKPIFTISKDVYFVEDKNYYKQIIFAFLKNSKIDSFAQTNLKSSHHMQYSNQSVNK